MVRACLLVIVIACLFPTLLHAQDFVAAAGDGNLAKMKVLFTENPGRLEEETESGKSAVHFAAQNNNLEMLNFLYDQDADIDKPNVVNQTPLMYAVFFGHEEAVKFLLEKGAGVSLVDEYGDTLLDMAVMEEYVGIIKLQRAKGAVESIIGEPELVKLAPSVQRLTFPYYEKPNIVVQTGSDGLLIVDTGWKRTGKLLAETLPELFEQQLELVINTHSHPDHIGGNQALAREDLPVIGFDWLAKHEENGLIRKGSKPLIGAAGSSFENWYSLEYNGELIHIIPYPGIHTEQDQLVHFTESKVAHIGDLLIGQSFPSVQVEVDRYLEFLKTIEGFFAPDVTLVWGHGREMNVAEVEKYRLMLTEVRDLVLKKLESGQDIETIKKSSELDKYAEYGVFIPILSSDYWVEAIGRQQNGG